MSAMTCIICHTHYSVINPFPGMAVFIFYPHSGMCGGCEEHWRASAEGKSAIEATGSYFEKLKALVAEHRRRREL